MPARSLLSHVGAVTTTLVLLLTAACDGSSAALQPDDGPLLQKAATPGASQSEWLKAVRRETSRFNSTTQARKAGYAPDTHCVAVPGLGGMGYHWANMPLVDATFDPLQPEVLLYATGPGGNLRLVGVEYIVLKRGQAWPEFAGHRFDDGGTPVPFPHWSLHVWLHEDNPNGIYAPFNPNVSCP